MLSYPLALARTVQISKTTQVYYLNWTVIAMLSTINHFGAAYYGLTFTNPETYIVTCAVLISISVLFYSIFGRSSRVSAMTRYLTLWIVSFPVARAFTYLLASLRFPVIDSALDSFDKFLGFNWLNWYHFLEAHSAIKHVLNVAYLSIPLQVLFSIIYFSHREECSRSNRLWLTAVVSFVITTLVSGFLPAVGAFEYYGIADDLHGVHRYDLHALLSGTLTSVSIDDLKGLITLPSYHAGCAIFLTYIYRNQRYMLFPVVPLNVLMLIATPAAGGHYLADVLAGAAVAAISIWIVEYAASRLGWRNSINGS